MIIAPGTFLTERPAMSINPNAAISVSGFVKSPMLTNVAPLATMIPPLFKPMKPINKPTPDPIAILKFRGILSNIHLRNGVTLIRKNKTPAIITAPKATCHEYPISPTTVKVKKAFSPIPGARPTGQLAKIPITRHARAAAKQVPTKLAP